jgi:predicted aspartyl protease
MPAILLLLLTIVPFTYHDNRMVVACTIDGKGPFSVILDTGSPEISITPETAAALGVTTRDAGTVTGAGNRAVKYATTKLATVTLGTATLDDVTAGVIDLSQIREKFHFPHLDGIIGYPLLRRYVTFVDVDAGTISLSDRLPNIPSSATTTHFTGVLPIIRAAINGIPTTVLVDTGDRSSFTLFGPFARRYGFFGKYPSQTNLITGYGLGGAVYADVFRLPQLDVLGTRLRDVVTRASRQTGGAFADPDHGGSIGTGILKRFNVVYDYAHATIVAWPSRYFRTPDAFVPPPG